MILFKVVEILKIFIVLIICMLVIIVLIVIYVIKFCLLKKWYISIISMNVVINVISFKILLYILKCFFKFWLCGCLEIV